MYTYNETKKLQLLFRNIKNWESLWETREISRKKLCTFARRLDFPSSAAIRDFCQYNDYNGRCFTFVKIMQYLTHLNSYAWSHFSLSLLSLTQRCLSTYHINRIISIQSHDSTVWWLMTSSSKARRSLSSNLWCFATDSGHL